VKTAAIFRDVPIARARVLRPSSSQGSAEAARTEPAALLTIESAAKLLATTPTALRARCRRHARGTGREVVARLGGGVVAFKFGVSWRVRFEPL
jgi:hypothetical protein